MTDYIERKRAIVDVCNSLELYPSEYAKMEDALNKISAADVAPVRHGQWFDKGEYAVCMECGGRSGTQYDGVEPIPLMTQFCPNCGCKMDLEG